MVVTYTVVYVSTSRFVQKVPFICAYIKLDGADSLLMQNIYMNDVTKIRVGMRVGFVSGKNAMGGLRIFILCHSMNRGMMTTDGKVIITAALTGGVHNKKANPNLPEQPAEIIQAAYDCYNAGAAVVHLHARDAEGNPTADPSIYRMINEGIRARCSVIIQNSTGGGPNLSLDERIMPLEAQPEMASLNMGTLVRTIGQYKGTVWRNTREDVRYFLAKMRAQNIKPELEVYNHSMIEEVEMLISDNLLDAPYVLNFVLAQPYEGALRGSVRNLVSLFTAYLPAGSLFTVSAIGRYQLPLTTLCMLIGGNVRVGLEDNIYYRAGELATSNAQLVERAVRIARELELNTASPEEARKILGLAAFL